MKTRITELLGIKYPIIQGGMQNLGTPELASAVSDAGGLGTINATVYPEPVDLQNAIRQTKKLTSKPFCVNISLLPDANVGDDTVNIIKLCGQEGVPVIETAGTSPKHLVEHIKREGIIHIHKVPAVSHALSAERAGVDAIIIVGLECGGHPGKDEVGTVVLTAKAAAKCNIPVISGGGYVDGRGMVAALALGAEGVVMGTRFVAVQECPIHQNFKQWILAASEKDTVLCQKSIKNMVRVANNATARQCIEVESKGNVTVKELLPVIGGGRQRKAYESGDIDAGLFPIGHAIGLIEDIPTVKEAIDTIFSEFMQTLDRLQTIRSN